jgi:phage shock protein C
MRSEYERQRRGLYRARDGAFLGVCKGIAEYLDFSVFWTRILILIGLIFTGIWPVGILYLVAGAIMKPEPVIPLSNDEDREFYSSYVSSRTLALQRLKQTFDRLERRIRRMEDIVTARDYDWERRLNNQ